MPAVASHVMRMLRGGAAALLSVAVLFIAGCGSDDGSSADVSSASNWTYSGTTGAVTVIPASTGGSAPTINVTTPFAVDQTQVHVLRQGTGEVVGDTATVLVNYVGVNGRTGKVFDSSFSNGSPVEFPLTGVIPGFAKAIAGQKVGSSIAVAIAPADGYTQGNPSAGIEAGDTLVFALDIVSLSS